MWDLEKYHKNLAIIDELGNRITYDRISIISNEIGTLVGRCLVVALCRNTVGSVVGYVSFINKHIVPIMLNVHLESALMNNILVSYKPSFIWCPMDELPTHQEWMEHEIVYQAYDYCLLKTNFDTTYSLYDELALLLTTSGSTGSPKLVRQSYANIEANMDSIIQYLKLDASERPITTLPMNYTYGLSIINSHIKVGATLLLTDKSFMQKEFWSFFKEQEATSFGGVPYTYEMLNRLRFFRMDLPSLRTMTQAGGKITTELHAKFAEFAATKGIKFVVMYGQCEATARMGYLPAEKSIEKCGSMGIAIPGGKFQLMNENGNPIMEPFTTGELIYEGPNVTLGYAEGVEDLAKGDERNGILQTGDMAQFDEDGFFYIVGRKKRFLKIYGNRVNLDEIDRLIKTAFDNIECVSSGVDDHMYLFLTKEDMADAVKQFIVEKTKLNPAAFKTVVVNEIPKNDSGKVLYKKLDELIL